MPQTAPCKKRMAYCTSDAPLPLRPLRPWSTPLTALLLRAFTRVLRVVAVMTCCFFAVRCGAAVERRRDGAIERRSSRPAQVRGELWMRCPSSTTWYSDAGDPREWREETTEEP